MDESYDHIVPNWNAYKKRIWSLRI